MTFRAQQRIDYWVGGLLLLLLFVPIRVLGILLRREHSTSSRKGCVVIKMVGAGSLFLAMPSMQTIRKQFPEGKFFLVGMRPVTSLAESYGWFDTCWTIDDSSLPRLVISTARVLLKMALHADHLIDLEVHSRLTTVLGVLSMIRNRLGFVHEIVLWRRGFYTHMTYFNTHGPIYSFYDLLAKWFDIEQIGVSEFHADFRAQVARTALPPDLSLPRRYVAVGHACSDLGRVRQLLPAEWKRLLRPSVLAGHECIFLGGAADAALADSIIAELGSGRNLCGQLTVAQSAKVIARATRFFGIDSMLLHIARALEVRPVSVWGPTDPATLLRPIGTGEEVAYVRMPCSPCLHITGHLPCQGRRDCMALALDSLVNASPTAQASGVAVGWDVSPNDPRTRAVSILYA